MARQESQADIERYNSRELWRDVAGNLRAATDGLERALGALEDLGFGPPEPIYQQIVTMGGRIDQVAQIASGEARK